MPNKFALAAGVMLISVLAACGDGAPPAPQGPATEVAAPVTAVSQRVEVAISNEDGQPLLVGPGGISVGQFAPPKAGAVSAAGVQVGNFGGTSDGMLVIKLCQDGECIEGQGDLSDSVDNEYMVVSFPTALNINNKSAIDITVTRVGGTGQFALWTYPAGTTLTAPDGVQSQRTLKVALDFKS